MSEPATMPATVTVTLPRWMFYHLMVIYLALLLVVGAGVWYVQSTVASAGRVQCGIYTQLDAAYRKAPPTTPAGRQFAASVHKVVTDLGCDEPVPVAPPSPTGEKPR